MILLDEIKAIEEEFEFLKIMMTEKLRFDELTAETIIRIMDRVYWAGHYVGRCRREEKK